MLPAEDDLDGFDEDGDCEMMAGLAHRRIWVHERRPILAKWFCQRPANLLLWWCCKPASCGAEELGLVGMCIIGVASTKISMKVQASLKSY